MTGKRKLFISADMEGGGAVASQHALRPDRWEWQAARQWMTAEVVAASEAAFEAGYSEVIVADSHGNGHNIDPDRLPDDVRLVRSWPRPLIMMEGVDDPDVVACAFIGYHGGVASRTGLLAHSFSTACVRALKVNDVDCSEGYLNAALAGERALPVLFFSGDNEAVADARRYIPESTVFASKVSLGRRSASALPPAQTNRLLKEALRAALAAPFPPPFALNGPLRLELSMINPLAAEMLDYLPMTERLDASTIAADFDGMTELMRFLSFALFYSPSGLVA